MKVLIIKMSSMGDIVHLFPALSDVVAHIPDIKFDWVVEKPFEDLPRLHKSINKVIPISLRHWRKNLSKKKSWVEAKDFLKNLKSTKYDLIIDAQGLLKSAVIGKLAGGRLVGTTWQATRESLACRLYDEQHFISVHHHAVTRLRNLFTKIFNLSNINDTPDFGIQANILPDIEADYKHKIVFLHSTTWSTKHIPLRTWQDLASRIGNDGHQILLPWVSQVENIRAKNILDYCVGNNTAVLPKILPKLDLLSMISVLNQSNGVVAVDTGLGHIAAALEKPIVSIYGATAPEKTGAVGIYSKNMSAVLPCSPCLSRRCLQHETNDFSCYKKFSPDYIWQSLQEMFYANQK
jgi:heptosyltransferase-1